MKLEQHTIQILTDTKTNSNILQVVSYDLTGDVIYQSARYRMMRQIRHRLQQQKTSTNSYYLTRLRKSFDAYYFDTDVER